MCAMSHPAETSHGRVGVRELRQNLSVYLRRVKAGESLEVTEMGRPVARLIPLTPAHRGRVATLLDEGRATAPRGDLLDRSPLDLGPGPTVLALLLEMRGEEER